MLFRYEIQPIFFSSEIFVIIILFSFQMPTSVIRMLLNHFHWDKGKLMERLYDGDQEKLFTEAHIVYPFAKASALAPNVECQVSFSYY